MFSIKWLETIFKDTNNKINENVQIEKVTTDSRIKVKNALFIPIIGEKFDGHQFVQQAIAQGSIAVLWDQKKELPTTLPDDISIFFVDDTLKALQKLAYHYRMEINPKVIGITGSNGKTTTKEMVASLMKTTYRTHHTEGNYNNEVGLPLTILSMPKHTEVLVLELGMNNFGEIELLSNIAKPDFAIITNIGESHIEFLGSREGIAKAKLEIMAGLNENGLLIIDGDEPLLNHIHTDEKVITCGFQSFNDLVIKEVQVKQNKTLFKLSDTKTYQIPLLGKHHAKNAIYAIKLGSILKMKTEKVHKALENLSIPSMRFELMIGMEGVTIINDAYNASPTSMKAAIDVVKEMAGFKRKVLVLGDILELGEHSKRLHQSIGEVVTPPITDLCTIGNDAKVIGQEVKQRQAIINSQHFHTREDLVKELKNYLDEQTLILFKASRGMEFESIIKTIIK